MPKKIIAADVLPLFDGGKHLTVAHVAGALGVGLSAATYHLVGLAQLGDLVIVSGGRDKPHGQKAYVFGAAQGKPPLSAVPSGWTEERDKLAASLYKEGLSASQIAKKLGGVSRNAVVGKLHRLGLSRSAEAGAIASKVNMRSKVSAVQPRRAAPGLRLGPHFSNTEQPAQPTLSIGKAFLPLPGSNPRPLIEMERGMCRWPVELGGESLSCCLPAADQPDGSWRYCEAHEVRAVNRAQPKAAKPFHEPRRRMAA